MSNADRVTVHVCCFAPKNDQGGIGGFMWSIHEDHALAEYEKHKNDPGLNSIVRLVPVEIDMKVSVLDDGSIREEEQITHMLDHMLEQLESTSRATRQFVPEDAQKEFIPTGGALVND